MRIKLVGRHVSGRYWENQCGKAKGGLDFLSGEVRVDLFDGFGCSVQHVHCYYGRFVVLLKGERSLDIGIQLHSNITDNRNFELFMQFPLHRIVYFRRPVVDWYPQGFPLTTKQLGDNSVQTPKVPRDWGGIEAETIQSITWCIYIFNSLSFCLSLRDMSRKTL